MALKARWPLTTPAGLRGRPSVGFRDVRCGRRRKARVLPAAHAGDAVFQIDGRGSVAASKGLLAKCLESVNARRLCCLTLDEPGRVVLGKEPLVVDGRAVGYVTSADMGYSVGRFIAYGYLPAALATKGQPVEIVYFGQPLRATVADDPLFDPGMTRLRS